MPDLYRPMRILNRTHDCCFCLLGDASIRVIDLLKEESGTVLGAVTIVDVYYGVRFYFM